MSDWAKETEEANRKQDGLLKFRLKRNGASLLICLAFTSLLLKGMPLHALWHPFGPIALIPTLYFFSAVTANGGMFVIARLLEREFRKRPYSLDAPYVAAKPRSGRRRSRMP